MIRIFSFKIYAGLAEAYSEPYSEAYSVWGDEAICDNS